MRNSNYPAGVTDATIERYFGEGYDFPHDVGLQRWECPWCKECLKGFPEDQHSTQASHNAVCPEYPQVRRAAMNQRYVVEWCSEIPLNECGDSDMDRAKYVRSPYKTLTLAIDFAKELIRLSKDAFGSVRVEEQEVRINDDILEHEGREVKQWHTVRYLCVDDENFKYSEKEWNYDE